MVEQKIDARIQPMEPSGSRLENVLDRSSVRKYWPQLLIVIFGLGLAAALFALQRAPVGGRSIVKITGVDPVYYFATAHSLLFDRDYDLTNDFQSLDPHQIVSDPGASRQPGCRKIPMRSAIPSCPSLF